MNEGDELNNSAISDFLLNTSINTSRIDPKNLNISLSGKEKLYLFKSDMTFTGNEKFFYSFILFTVKNEFSSNNIMQPITIGDNRIPINIIINSFKERCFEGSIDIRLRNFTTIGHIKLRLQIDDLNSANILTTISNRRILEDMENSNDFNGINNDSKTTIWDRYIIHFNEIDSSYLEKYFFKDAKNNQSSRIKIIIEFIANANNIIQEKNIDGRLLQKYYLEAVKDENYVAIYEVLNILLSLSIKQEFNTISDFIRNMSVEEKANFFDLCFNHNFNAFIMNVFLNFFCNCQKYFKVNKSSIIRNNKFFNDTEIIEMIYKAIKKITQFIKNNSPSFYYFLQLRDGVLWCINNLAEIITQPSGKFEIHLEMQGKPSKESNSIEQKMAEYTEIYNICIILMGYRITLLKLIDAFYDDSQIMSGLFRIMRKATQIITNENSSFLDLTKLKSSPKDISKMFKNVLIEKHDGVFINSLRIMLKKYQHYPELHYNVLIILFQLTINIDSKSLYFTAQKLDLDEFKNNFTVYRGKLRAFSKLINQMHLKILCNFSQLVKYANEYCTDEQKEEEFYKIIYSIYLNIRSFYRLKKDANRLQDFILRKYLDIEIHDTLIRIVYNLSKHKEILTLFWEENNIIEDLINFIFKIAQNNQNFVANTIENKKNINIDEGKKILTNIMENSITVLLNLFSFEGKQTHQFDTFIENLVMNYVSKANFLKIIELAKVSINNVGCNTTKMEAAIVELEKKVNSYW